jgi:hypothetical protein
MILHHEPWTDEMTAFTLSKKLKGVDHLFYATRYEGHPKLWFIILYACTRISTNVLLVQMVQLAIIWTTVLLFLFRFPEKPMIKAIIVFGYFFIYEYSIFFRNYSMVFLFLFLCVINIIKNKHGWIALCFFLLFQTHGFGALSAVALWCIYIWNNYKTPTVKFIFANVIMLLALLLFYYSVKVPPDANVNLRTKQFSFMRLCDAVYTIWKAFIPLQILDIHFWDTNIISELPNFPKTFIAIIGIVLILTACLYHLRSSKKAIAFFLIGIGIILWFAIFKYRGFLRHHGFMYMDFLVAWWLMYYYPDNPNAPQHYWLHLNGQSLRKKILPYTLLGILLLQIIAAFIPYYYDYRYRFSNAQIVAQYIEKNYKKDIRIVAYDDTYASPIAGFMNKDFYFPNSGRVAMNTIWDTIATRKLTEDSLVNSYLNQKRIYKDALLISTDSLQSNKVILIKRFDPTIVVQEQYFLYR